MFRLLPSPLVRALHCRRWTETQARLILETAARWGLSIPEFARRYRLDERRLVTLERRLTPSANSPPPLTFVEVSRPAASPSAAIPHYEIQLATGEVLRIEGDVDARSLGAVLAVLRAERRC